MAATYKDMNKIDSGGFCEYWVHWRVLVSICVILSHMGLFCSFANASHVSNKMAFDTSSFLISDQVLPDDVRFLSITNFKNIEERLSKTSLKEMVLNKENTKKLFADIEFFLSKSPDPNMIVVLQKFVSIKNIISLLSNGTTGRMQVWISNADSSSNEMSFNGIIELKPYDSNIVVYKLIASALIELNNLSSHKHEYNVNKGKINIDSTGVLYIDITDIFLTFSTSEEELRKINTVIHDPQFGKHTNNNRTFKCSLNDYLYEYSGADILTFSYLDIKLLSSMNNDPNSLTKDQKEFFEAVDSFSYALYIKGNGFKDEFAAKLKDHSRFKMILDNILIPKNKTEWKSLPFLYASENIINIFVCGINLNPKNVRNILSTNRELFEVDSKDPSPLSQFYWSETANKLDNCFDGEFACSLGISKTSLFYMKMVGCLRDYDEFVAILKKESLHYGTMTAETTEDLLRPQLRYDQDILNVPVYYMSMYPIILFNSAAIVCFPGSEAEEIKWFWNNRKDVRSSWDELFLWENAPLQLGAFVVIDACVAKDILPFYNRFIQNTFFRKAIEGSSENKEIVEHLASTLASLNQLSENIRWEAIFYIGKEKQNGLWRIGSYSSVPISSIMCPFILYKYASYKNIEESMGY